jgi:outer membrane autotransporter protein
MFERDAALPKSMRKLAACHTAWRVCALCGWLSVLGAMGVDIAHGNCVVTGRSANCDALPPNPWPATVGLYDRSNNWTVTLSEGAQVVVGDFNAIAVGSDSTIVLGPDTLVQNTALTGGGLAGGGAETIVLRSGGRITIAAGARLIGAGTQLNSSSIEASEGKVSIDNSGLIQNLLDAGLLLNSGSSVVNRASGVITSLQGGSVFFGTSSLTLVNYGVINGAVELDGGTNLVTVYPGSRIAGFLALGGGENTLTLAGEGQGSFTNAVSGLSHLVKIDTGVWAFGPVSGAPQTIDIQSGQLRLGADAATASAHIAAGALLDAPSEFLPRQIASDGLVRTAPAGAVFNYAGALSGSGALEKQAAGELELSGQNTYGGPTFVDGGTLSARTVNALSAQSTIVLAPAATLAVHGAQTIGGLSGSVDGSGTVLLDAATLSTGANGQASMFGGVIAGTGGLAKTGQSILVLTGASTYQGATSVTGGELMVNGSLDSPVSVGSGAKLSGIGTISRNVTNAGLLAPGVTAQTFEVPVVSVNGTVGAVSSSFGAAAGALTIGGDYTSTGGALALRSHLNDGGPGNQFTDRLLIGGTASGETVIHVTPEGGSHPAMTGVTPASGISIVQVGGGATPQNFTLPGGYVAAGPYQMRLVHFTPAQSAPGELDPALAARGVTQFNDFRLQTEQVLLPGTPPEENGTGEPIGIGPDGELPGQEVVVPQVPAYLALPTGALHYASVLLDDLHKRVGELAPAALDGIDGHVPNAFVRVKGWTGTVSGSLQPDFHQRIWMLQAGGGVTWAGVLADGDRVDGNLVLSQGGSRSTVDVNHSVSRFDATGFGLTATYRSAGGAYADLVAQGIFFTSVDFSTDQRGSVGSTSGSGFVTSLEAGLPLVLGHWAVLEPRAALAYQTDHFRPFTDVDGVQTDLGNASSLAARVGARLSHAFAFQSAHGAGEISPFITVDYVRSLVGHNHETIGGVLFYDDTGGNALKYGCGIAVQLQQRMSGYVSFEHASGRGAPSATGNEILGTFRYVF